MQKNEIMYLQSEQEKDLIDFVILWVDGNDPDWLAEKGKYDAKESVDSNGSFHFRDYGLMKYWFRAIESFAPWVRTIHFVTWGHTPDFLKLDHPKLHIVRHEDFLPADSLPTFNSCSIEMSIHKIEGLADHFIYFNDDMFLLRPLTEDSFFHEELPVCVGREVFQPPMGKLMAWYGVYCNALGLINQHFEKKAAIKKNRKKYIHTSYGLKWNIKTLMMELLYPERFVGFELPHGPAAYCKRSFEALWEAEPELLRQTTASKFRTCYDVSQWAVLWWQIASGQFYPGRVDNMFCYADTWAVDEICHTIRKQTHDMICINDPDDPIDFEITSNKIREAFETILPSKSSFEK